MKHWLVLGACGVGLVLANPSASSPSAPEPEADGAKEFGAAVAESRENFTTSRVEELALEQRRLERGTIQRGRAYVQMLRSGLLPLSGGFEQMLRHIHRAERLGHALSRDVARRAQLEREQRELEAGIKELRHRRALLAQNLEDYELSRDAILAARDREAAFQRAFSQGFEADDHTAIYAAPLASANLAPLFADAKGRLPLPVAGRAEVRAVVLPDALGPGVFIAVQPGAQVKTVFGGKVVLTGEYGELGRSVVIDHGDGFSTLSGSLGSVTVEVGETLAAGEAIGALSERGDGNLYFEVRQAGSAVEPAAWFGL
jgi:murein hydrolase activator